MDKNDKNKMQMKKFTNELTEIYKSVDDKINNAINNIKAIFKKSYLPNTINAYIEDMKMFNELESIFIDFITSHSLLETKRIKTKEIEEILNRFSDLDETNINLYIDDLFLNLRKLINECRLIIFIEELCKTYLSK